LVASLNPVVLPAYSVTEVQIPSVLPSFSIQPQSQAINVGDTVTLSAAASGLPAPSLQWYFNGAPMAGATGGSFTISNAALTNAGQYSVVALNSAGQAQSQVASVSVSVVPPSFISISVPSSVKVKKSVSMSVVATGTMPLQYQWYFYNPETKADEPIAGATAANYSIPAAALRNTGRYHVKISNSAGSVSSTWSSLNVSGS
jgi:mannan endo-1,4-beta-mannosidase